MKPLGLVGRYHLGGSSLRLSFLFDKAKKKKRQKTIIVAPLLLVYFAEVLILITLEHS